MTATVDAVETKEPFRVAVFADFVCPYSFLAVEQIDRIARDYGLTPMWRCARQGRAPQRMDERNGARSIRAHPAIS
jgi:2-hydroxychromene-2-carboxylate isomerase